MIKQQVIHFHGTVHGVGFRFAACSMAAGYDITGYVKNLPDGSVECVAEGENSEIEKFVEELSGRMSGYIRSIDKTTAPANGNWTGFGVKY